jgi:hypothetical protein
MAALRAAGAYFAEFPGFSHNAATKTVCDSPVILPDRARHTKADDRNGDDCGPSPTVGRGVGPLVARALVPVRRTGESIHSTDTTLAYSISDLIFLYLLQPPDFRDAQACKLPLPAVKRLL